MPVEVAQTVAGMGEALQPMIMNAQQLAEYLEASPLEQLTLPMMAAKYGFTYSKDLGLFFKTATVPLSNPESILTTPAKTLFENMVNTGSYIGKFGGAAIKQAAANLTLTVKEGVTAAAGLLATPLPTAFAALAPVAGVGAGVALYKSNPEFWEKLSRKLLPFMWGDSPFIKSLTGEDGLIYYPRGAINAIRETVQEYKAEYPELHPIAQPGQGETVANFIYSTGTIGDLSPYQNTSSDNAQPLRRWNNPVKGTMLADAMRFESGRTFRRVRTTDKTTEIINAEGTLLTFTPPGAAPLDDEDLLLDVAFSQSASNIGRFLWHTNRWTLAVDPYLVKIGSLIYLGVEIKNGSKPWYPNIEWQPGYYILGSPLIGVEEIGDLKEHDLEEELPDITPTVITNPSIEVITGTTEDGEPETEEWVPVPMPNVDPSPWLNPNPSTEEFPSDYPYPITPTNLPELIITLSPTPESDPEDDPSTDGNIDTDIPTDAPAPPDMGETPTPDVVITPPFISNGGGLIKVYNPTATELRNFGTWMWQTWSGNVADTLQKLFLNSPLDGIIGLHEFYATPETSGRDTIRCGFLDSNISALLVSNRYTTINCGSVLVPEYYGNYLDYAPYTKISLYLPFVGIVNLEADDVIGHAINVTYKADSYTGCVAAMVTSAKANFDALLYQFEGNAAVTIPLSAGSQTALVTSALSMGASAIGGMITGGIAGAASAIAGAGIRTIGAAKASVSHSGAFGGTYGAMGVKKPYLVIRRPVQKITNYADVYGYPSHKRVTLKSCSGYVRVTECEFSSATATEAEKRMILDGLKSGVYV